MTFIEVMVTLVILSVGLVATFETFFISLERTRHLTNRLYVTTLMDNKILEISRQLKIFKSLPMDLDNEDEINVGMKVLKLNRRLEINEVPDFVDLFEVTISYSWQENSHQRSLSRTAYISSL